MADAAESPGGQRAWAPAGPRTLPEGRVPDAPALWGDVGVRASLPVTCRREQPGTQQAGPDPAACPSGFPASVPRGAALASRPVLDAGQTGLTAVSSGSQEQLRDPPAERGRPGGGRCLGGSAPCWAVPPGCTGPALPALGDGDGDRRSPETQSTSVTAKLHEDPQWAHPREEERSEGTGAVRAGPGGGRGPQSSSRTPSGLRRLRRWTWPLESQPEAAVNTFCSRSAVRQSARTGLPGGQCPRPSLPPAVLQVPVSPSPAATETVLPVRLALPRRPERGRASACDPP